MDTQQVQTSPPLLAQRETQVHKEEKSTLRHQLDDLLFGSVSDDPSQFDHICLYGLF